MKGSDIRSMTLEEIESKIDGEKAALSKLKFAHAVSPIENPMRIREQRKLVARLMTEFNAKKQAQDGN